MGQRIGGKFEVSVDGVVIEVKGEGEYSLGGDKNTGVVAESGRVVGFTSEGTLPFFSIDAYNTIDLDIAWLTSRTDSTVMVEMPNSKVLTIRNAWYAEEKKGKTKEGTNSLRFEGLSASID